MAKLLLPFLYSEQPSDEDQPVIVVGRGGILLNPDNPIQYKGASKVIIYQNFRLVLIKKSNLFFFFFFLFYFLFFFLYPTVF